MTLAIPTNLANRDNVKETVLSLLESLPRPLTYHVFDGKPAATSVQSDELHSAASTIASCSIVYALEGVGGVPEPVAGFVANESLKTVQLLHLIDDQPPTGNGVIQHRTMEMLGVFIRYIYADFDWVDRVTVPSNVQLIDDLFDLRVTGNDVSTITLTDTKHRPKSSRTFGG